MCEINFTFVSNRIINSFSIKFIENYSNFKFHFFLQIFEDLWWSSELKLFLQLCSKYILEFFFSFLQSNLIRKRLKLATNLSLKKFIGNISKDGNFSPMRLKMFLFFCIFDQNPLLSFYRLLSIEIFFQFIEKEQTVYYSNIFLSKQKL